jgi:uridine monophosphate synthetase
MGETAIKTMTYDKRIETTQNPTAKKLFQIMSEKQTNLSVSADVTDSSSLIKLVEQVGTEICVLKTHIDIITDFNEDLVKELLRLKEKYNFLIFEDRKFADIGNTVKLQYSQGIYHIIDWADIINCHIVPGPGIIEGLQTLGLQQGRGLLLIAEMSSKDNLATDNYTQTAIQWAEHYSDFVIGFIGMKKLVDDPKFLTMTPGVQFGKPGDTLGQQYATPGQVISNGSDIIIVGRGIYQAEDPAQAAKEYRKAGWEAYLSNQ